MLMPPPYWEEHDGYLARYLQTGEKHLIGIGREVEARCKDGSIVPVDLAISEVEHSKSFIGILRDITQRKRLEHEVVEIAILEQQRIGQDLHDECGQQLTALGLLADSLVVSLAKDKPADAEIAAKVERGLKSVLRQVRNISQGLSLGEIEPDGLPAALTELVSRLSETSGVHCVFQGDKEVSIDDSLCATHLYHIAQEACTNALKHAQARNIEARLQSSDHAVILQIQDDGIGILKDVQKGLGMRIMRNRASLISATLTIEPAEPHGTVVICTLPEERGHAPK
jgi:signal transduction histidine kinase